MAARPARNRFLTASQALGLIGESKANISIVKMMPMPIMTRCAIFWRRKKPRPIHHNGSIQGFIGLMALKARHKGIIMLTPRTRKFNSQIQPMSVRNPMPASFNLSMMIWSMRMALWIYGCARRGYFKYGSGTGTNFSSLRSGNENLSGGGKSSGLMSFLKVGDRSAGAIKSGGTTRRAAKMVVVNIDHPDIEEFINWKIREEQKVAALVAGSKIYNIHLNRIMAAANDATVPACHDVQARIMILLTQIKILL